MNYLEKKNKDRKKRRSLRANLKIHGAWSKHKGKGKKEEKQMAIDT
jgi:hypothetical protein